ncbi:fungal-specific transcription factor domain-containing protein [Mycena rebaudengoi]|nr:fungal-specific transcription factor domain-containing protein [Mycena rebaudengoi]
MSTTTTTITTAKAPSRMRAHKGNVPSLPQTKYCSLCPAKFTRTTHLNRHLRSHTNERLHRCNLCKTSEFTRSDLLTRHKRTCGQSINRSRRKSCEACAESKIKCNLEYPCAKCTSRGRECVFQNDPEESRTKSSASKASSRKATNSPKLVDSPLPSSPASEDLASPVTPDLSSDFSASPGSSRSASASPPPPFFSLPELSNSPSSSRSSSLSSPTSDDLPCFDDHTFDFSFDVDLSIGPYDDPLGSVSPLDQALFLPGFLSSSLLDAPRSQQPRSIEDSLHCHNICTSLIQSSPPCAAPAALMSQPTVTLDCLGALDLSRAEDPETYLHLFFTEFLAQVPLIHASTWKMETTSPTLARVFQACGALFVKTPAAFDFVSATLVSVTEQIRDEFSTMNTTSSDSCVPRHTHQDLILALVLLQTICLFQRQSQNSSPNVQHHAMLIAMIRQTGLINRVGSWTAPDWSDPISLEAAWMEWVHFATIKRALLFSYLHDCCHCMYSSSPPSFSPAELDVHLPCDDALWQASSASEWFKIAHTPSPYGVGIERIYGVGMQHALSTLTHAEKSSAEMPLTLNPFALFILIHTILRNISVAQAEHRSPPVGGWSCFAMVSAAIVPDDFTSKTQLVLDNWLHLWLNSPDAKPLQDNAAAEPPFVYNSLPFYWLAQVLLWENSIPLQTRPERNKAQLWLDPVKSFVQDSVGDTGNLSESVVGEAMLL